MHTLLWKANFHICLEQGLLIGSSSVSAELFYKFHSLAEPRLFNTLGNPVYS